MKNPCLMGAAVIAAMIPVWIFLILPHVLWRIPPDYQKKVLSTGYINAPDPKTNRWTQIEPMVYEREKRILKRDGAIGVIKDRYVIRDPMTGKITWEYAPEFTVDLKSGMVLKGQGMEGTLYDFPLHTQKKTYTISREYYKNLPFRFVEEDELDGLKTYVFEFGGVAEYAECYSGTDEFPGVKPPEGQEIRSRPSLIIRYWVEPLSGQIVKIEEDCPDGDWIVDAKTGEEMAPVLIWGGKSTGDAVVLLTEGARARRQEIMFRETVIPVGLALLACALGIAGYARRKEPRG